MFITFEGMDGAGKSTQAKLLFNKLRQEGQNTILSREPGGTPLAEKIREIIINDDMDVETQFFLFNAARRDHVMNKIKPALINDQIVICDRFFDSTFVYQNEIGEDLIYMCQHKATDFLYPDITFIIDIPPEIAMKRLEERGNLNSFDKKPIDYYIKNRDLFYIIAEKHSKRCRFIDGNRNEDFIHEEILKIVEENMI